LEAVNEIKSDDGDKCQPCDKNKEIDQYLYGVKYE
jgi:hypothetical protein